MSHGIELTEPLGDRHGEILSDDALAFVAGLHHTFNERRLQLLAARSTTSAPAIGGSPFPRPICPIGDVRSRGRWIAR